MKSKKAIVFWLVIFFLLGISGLFRFSQEVATVKVLGLFFSGMVSGLALMNVIINTLKSRQKTE
jgi:hypothetical protein